LRIIQLGLLCCVFIIGHRVALASTFVPQSREFVLYKLSEQEAKINIANRHFRFFNQSTKSVIEFATRLVNLSKQSGDPRYYGRAESAISKLNKSQLTDRLKNRVRLIEAEIAQFHHQFEKAIHLLNVVLDADPTVTDALLLRAQLHYALGNYELSQHDCKRTLFLLPSELTATCFFMTRGLQNSATWAVANSQSILHMLSSPIPSKASTEIKKRSPEYLWIYSVLADVLLYQGELNEAFRTVKKGLTEFPDSPYLLTIHADILLQTGRLDELLQGMPAETTHLPLLVRLSIAESRQRHQLSRKKYTQRLEQIFNLEKARGEKIHLRERALFEFAVKKNIPFAWNLATKNWKAQREPIDAKIVLRSRNARPTFGESGPSVVELWEVKNRLNLGINRFLFGDF